MPTPAHPTRRKFLKSGAAASLVPLFAQVPHVFAAGSDRLRLGLVGCGGRGIGAVRDCLTADPSAQLVAMGDAFADRVEAATKNFREGTTGTYARPPLEPGQFAATPETCFVGFDAFQKVIDAGIDVVILAAPPGFRPAHLEAAINAGIHIFTEKPVAVDPTGARKVLQLAEVAKQKNLAVVAGTQRRHSADYLETMARIRDGAIGEITGGQCYWMQEGLWHRGRQPEWSEMEYQMRNWLYFTWLSGDHIVEQHVHNIDVMNWALGGPPVKALGMGGRQSRTDPKYGDAWDHFSIEFEYANGVRVQSFCRQTPGASGRVTERLVGTLGSALPSGTILGPNAWKYQGETPRPYVHEHVNLLRSIREGKPLNELRQVTESTLTAILGRLSAYSGREVSWNWLLNASKLDLTPPALAWGDAPAVSVPVPGQTQLV